MTLPGDKCSDITYLPMRRGFLHLAAITDLHTRKVLSWRFSKTLEADFCVEAPNEAIHKFGPPEIMITDQGSQFTSFVWIDRLRRSGVRISHSHTCKHALPGQWMDGKGRFLHSRGLQANHCRAVDNIFMERLSRALKYDCVCLHA